MKITDSLGTYDVSIKNRPIDFNDRQLVTQLHLAIFQEPEVRNKATYTINLSYKIAGSKRFEKFNASMINMFEPMRWMRNFDENDRIQKLKSPFYFDWIRERKRILHTKEKNEIKISPTAGFFHEVLSSNGFIGETFLDAYATFHWLEEDHEPIVNIRFFDFTYTSMFLEENQNWYEGSKEPRWRELIYIEPNKHIKVA